MATSDVEICNIALTNLGQRRIISLDDPVKNARKCKLVFDPLRKAVLRAHPWNCAIKRKSLPKEGTDPAYGFNHQYVLPVDCLRVLEMENDHWYAWEVESGRVVTNYGPPINIKYVWDNKDVTTFDEVLDNALAARISMELAYDLTQNNNTVAAMKTLYDEKLQEARSMSGQENVMEVDESGSWLESRWWLRV